MLGSTFIANVDYLLTMQGQYPTNSTWFLFHISFVISQFFHFLSWHRQSISLFGPRGIAPAYKRVELAKNYGKGCINLRPEVIFDKIFGSKGFGLNVLFIAAYVSLLCLLFMPSLFACVWAIVFFLNSALVHLIGQFGLQTDSMMVETSFLAMLSTPLAYCGFPTIACFVFRFFMMRMMLNCGIAKFCGPSQSKEWKNGTAMMFHYYTQPLPNPLSYYAYHMHPYWHKFEVLFTWIAEIPATILCLLPTQIPRVICFLIFTGLLIGINTTGNFGCLGIASVAMSIPLLDDHLLYTLFGIKIDYDVLYFPFTPIKSTNLNKYFNGGNGDVFTTIPAAYNLIDFITIALFIFIILQALLQLCCLMMGSFRFSWRIVNRYARFGSMTTFRNEIAIEGYDGEEKIWKQYEFKYKNYDGKKMPQQVAPFWPRFDWHLWFLPLRWERGREQIAGLTRLVRFGRERNVPINTLTKYIQQLQRLKMYCGEPDWYKKFLLGCLKNDEIILGLIKTNPWHGKIPPIYVRSKLYSFEFSPPSKRVCFGIMGIKGNDKNKPWFSSEYVGLYGSTYTLNENKDDLLEVHVVDGSSSSSSNNNNNGDVKEEDGEAEKDY